MSFTIIFEIILTLGGFIFKYFGANDEQMKWLSKSADRLREKGWIRANYILELEKSRDTYIDDKIKKAELDKNGTRINK